MNCYRCGDESKTKNRLLLHFKKCKKTKNFKAKNVDICFLCDKKILKRQVDQNYIYQTLLKLI